VDSPELLILAINLVIVLLCYLVINPITAGCDLNRISINDICASVTSLLIAGFIFWGSEVSFNLILLSANWFWFSIITFVVIEVPFMFWYFKKHNVKLPK